MIMLNHPDSRLVEKKIMWIGLFRYRLFPKICLCSCYRLNITMHFAVGSTGRSNVTNHILGRDCILVPGPVHNLCLLRFESLWSFEDPGHISLSTCELSQAFFLKPNSESSLVRPKVLCVTTTEPLLLTP